MADVTLHGMFERTMPERPGAALIRDLLREQFYLGALAAVTLSHNHRDDLLAELADWLATRFCATPAASTH